MKMIDKKKYKQNKIDKGKFSWQEGYEGFSYLRSQRNNIIQ
jgi:hypothetical protein